MVQSQILQADRRGVHLREQDATQALARGAAPRFSVTVRSPLAHLGPSLTRPCRQIDQAVLLHRPRRLVHPLPRRCQARAQQEEEARLVDQTPIPPRPCPPKSRFSVLERSLQGGSQGLDGQFDPHRVARQGRQRQRGVPRRGRRRRARDGDDGGGEARRRGARGGEKRKHACRFVHFLFARATTR